MGRKSIERYVAWALGDPVQVVSREPLEGGIHCNQLLTLHLQNNLCQYVLRQMPPQPASGFARQEVIAYDLAAEFTVLKELEATLLATPTVYGLDPDGQFLGTPAFLMEYIEGPTVLAAIKSKPDSVLSSLVQVIVAMNSITAEQVPSLPRPRLTPGDPSGWLAQHSAGLDLPHAFQHGLTRLADIPTQPLPAFSNGDLNPLNFICRQDGSVAVVDWEYAGFHDPLLELMLLHVWPEDDPFLDTYPLDILYCQRVGIDPAVLWWYELYAALSGWIYAAKDHRQKTMLIHEQWLNRLIS